ncbi:MAG: VWA domain-containing protein [Bdellovibrionales bacterium]|nr:VWA domain-containing protein [Bdellovibrionales bacterium]
MFKRTIFKTALCAGLAILAPQTALGSKPTPTPKVDVVFVLDTTGSMSGLINAAKEKIWSIASTLSDTTPAPEIRIGLVGYRDRGDAYVTTRSALTTDLDAVYGDLMKFEAGGGGDGPESVNQALNEAVTRFDWSQDPDAYKVVFLVGDAPPHMDYQDDVPYRETVNLALNKGIIINTIQCGNMESTTPIWNEIAKFGEGVFAKVEQSGGALLAATPYDSKLAELSSELDKTRVAYGDHDERAAQAAKFAMSDAIAEEATVSALARRSELNVSAAGKANFLGSKELVEDVSTGKVSLEKLDQAQLPQELRDVGADEQKRIIAEKKDKRDKIESEIRKLSQARQDYLKKEAAKSAGEKPVLDEVIFSAIKTQAGAKGLTYDSGPHY